LVLSFFSVDSIVFTYSPVKSKVKLGYPFKNYISSHFFFFFFFFFLVMRPETGTADPVLDPYAYPVTVMMRKGKEDRGERADIDDRRRPGMMRQ